MSYASKMKDDNLSICDKFGSIFTTIKNNQDLS